MAKSFRITGHVQGVFFRANAKERAETLGLTGWVRNHYDGSVEIHAEGKVEMLRALEQWCQRGPEAARVDAIDTKDVPVQGCTGFVIM